MEGLNGFLLTIWEKYLYKCYMPKIEHNQQTNINSSIPIKLKLSVHFLLRVELWLVNIDFLPPERSMMQWGRSWSIVLIHTVIVLIDSQLNIDITFSFYFMLYSSSVSVLCSSHFWLLSVKNTGQSFYVIHKDWNVTLSIRWSESHHKFLHNYTSVSVAGVDDNDTIKLYRSGGADPEGGQPGDLYVTIKVMPVFIQYSKQVLIYKWIY